MPPKFISQNELVLPFDPYFFGAGFFIFLWGDLTVQEIPFSEVGENFSPGDELLLLLPPLTSLKLLVESLKSFDICGKVRNPAQYDVKMSV